MTFAAGETSVSFNITINNDAVLEYNETFNLIIIEDSLPKNVTRGKTYLAKVIILNDGGSSKCAVQLCVITSVGEVAMVYMSRNIYAS